MITTISLSTICHHIQLQKISFLAIRTFKIYSLRNFQMCNTALTTVALLFITPPWLTIEMEVCLFWFLSTQLPTFFHPPLLATKLFSVSKFACFKIPDEIIQNVFLCLISFSIMPSSSIHVIANGKISFFYVPFFTHFYIPFSLSIHLSMDTQVEGNISFLSKHLAPFPAPFCLPSQPTSLLWWFPFLIFCLIYWI